MSKLMKRRAAKRVTNQMAAIYCWRATNESF